MSEGFWITEYRRERDRADELQSTVERLAAALRGLAEAAHDAIDWTGIASEPEWDRYLAALPDTEGERCPTCGSTDRGDVWVTRPDLHGPTHCANPFHRPDTEGPEPDGFNPHRQAGVQ